MFNKDVEQISRRGWSRQTLNREPLNRRWTHTYMPDKVIGHIQRYQRYMFSKIVEHTSQDINYTCSIRMLNTYQEEAD